jgi:hypothetical protein
VQEGIKLIVVIVYSRITLIGTIYAANFYKWFNKFGNEEYIFN